MIRRRSPAYASLTEPQPLTAPDVQKAAGRGDRLLDFARGEKHELDVRGHHRRFEIRAAARQNIDAAGATSPPP